MWRRARGFTLVELLVVISIIVILAGLALAGLRSARTSSRKTATESIMARLTTALNAFKNDFQSYPAYYPLTLDNTPTSAGGRPVFPADLDFSIRDDKHFGPNPVLGALWGTPTTASVAQNEDERFFTASRFGYFRQASIPRVTYLDNADLAPKVGTGSGSGYTVDHPTQSTTPGGGEAFGSLVDPWDQPLGYIYMVGYKNRDNTEDFLRRDGVQVTPNHTAWMLSPGQLTEAGRVGDRSGEVTFAGSAATRYYTVFGRPTRSPAPWRDNINQFPYAMEFELWSSGPDMEVDNCDSHAPVGGGDIAHNTGYLTYEDPGRPTGLERMHETGVITVSSGRRITSNVDNLSGSQWRKQ